MTCSTGRITGPGRRSGFTLLELLVVVTIIGILAAIAIPQYAIYRQSGFDARAKSDLRNAANGEEAYFLTSGGYVDCNDAGCQAVLPDFRLSATVSIGMVASNSASPSFRGTATCPGGSRIFTFDSGAGGMQP